jgi:DNA repair protein RadD
MTLFPDQLAAQQAYFDATASGFRAPILVAPTGFGKTHWAADLIAQLVSSGGRVWFLAHLEELLWDTASRLEGRGVRFGWIWAKQPRDPEAKCQVASVATARDRIGSLGAPPDLVVIDECHRTTTSYYRVLAALGHPPVVGLTGTPIRMDGRSMRSCGYDHLIRTPDTADLIGMGRLSPLDVWSFPPPTGLERLRESQQDQAIAGEILSGRAILGDALEAWANRCRDRPTAVFCSGVKAARETAEIWRRAGFRAMAVDGTSSKDERRLANDLIQNSGIDALMSADMYIAGWNIKDLGAIVCLRHTDSLIIWQQMVGRGLRKSTVWPDCVLHDHAGNARRPGLGHPLARRMHLWSLDNGSDRRHREAIPGVRVCEACYSTAMVGNTCQECGRTRVIKTPKQAVLLPGDLVRMDEREEAALAAQPRREEGQCQTLQDWAALGTARGYANPMGWARVRHGMRQKRRLGKVR